MGLFKKKEKQLCPICGNELKLLHSLSVADGQICESCEKRIRGQFEIEEYWKKRFGATGASWEDYKLKQYDPLQEMAIAEIRELVASMDEDQAAILRDYGSDYANIAKAGKCFTIAPKAVDVGLKRAKALKNRLVVTAEIVSGEFCRGDGVSVLAGEREFRTSLLDVIECSGSSTFETELHANMGKHKASAGSSAWLFLDIQELIPENSLIRK